MEFNLNELKQFQSIGKNLCFYTADRRFDSILNAILPAQIENVSSRLVYYWKEKKRPIPLNQLLAICRHNKVKSIGIKYLSNNGGKKLLIPSENNIKLHYLLGLILGDGCLSFNEKVNGGSYTLQITTRSKSEAYLVKKLLAELFEVNSSIYKAQGCYNTCCFSKALVMLLNKRYSIPIGKKYKTMKVPEFIYKKHRAIKYFIRGVFDSDGNVYINKNRKAVQLRQHSKNFICEMQILFKKLGVDIRGPYYDKANNSWLLWSSKIDTVNKFYEKIYPNDIGLVTQLG